MSRSTDIKLQQPTAQTCDVLVIGGGPAGSTISAFLAQKGWDVVVIEKARHPRFHIGESLLPLNLPLLEELGVLEDVRRIGVMKYGAEFNAPQVGEPVTFYFSKALDKGHPYAFEVRRSEFDELLLRNSAAKGAHVLEGVKVTQVEFHSGQCSLVTAENENGDQWRWQTRFLVDASGRDTFLAGQLRIKRRNSRHNSAAIFGHFDGVPRRPGRDAGNISIYWFEYGWLWMIPLRDNIMSVGAVCWPEYLKTRRCELEEFLLSTIRRCPAAGERMKQTQLVSPVTATGNYSYQASSMVGDGYLMVGDAFAFIDPVFSTGVYLAMSGGRLGADVVDACLKDPAVAPRKLKEFERVTRRGLKTLSWLIYRFTSPTIRRMFMGPRNVFRVEEAVISLLAGDLFGGTRLRGRLLLFKAIYYGVALTRWRQNLAAYLLRKRNVNSLFTEPSQAKEQLTRP